MIRTLARLIPAAVALALLAACGGSGAAPAAPAPTGQPARPTAAADPSAAPEPTAEPEATAASTERTADIKDISGNLDSLKSYRLTFSFTFDGKDKDGKPQKGLVEIVQAVNRETNDQYTRFVSNGGAAGDQSGAFEMYRVGGVSYMLSDKGEQKCVGFSSSEQPGAAQGLIKPSDIVGGVDRARLVGRGERVNGVLADHYSFDKGGLSFGVFADASGDAWLAQDGGYVVKYKGTATGKNVLFGGGEGTFIWEYNLTDVNAVGAIALPKECEGQAPAQDIPFPPGATDKSGFGGMQTFKIKEAPADVAAFFTKEMPAQGWKAGKSSTLGDLTTLEFTKDARKLTINITKGDDGTTVLMMEAKS
jgi:hypothetical protein